MCVCGSSRESSPGGRRTCQISSCRISWCSVRAKWAASCLWWMPVEIHVCDCFLHQRLAAFPAFLPTPSLFLSSTCFLLHSVSSSVCLSLSVWMFFFFCLLYPLSLYGQSFFWISRTIWNHLTAANHLTATKSHSLHLNTNKQPCTNTYTHTHTHTHTHPSSGALDTLCLTSCWETEAHTCAERVSQSGSQSCSQPASQPASQPKGCDIVVKGPEEVDNSAASGVLGSEGRNEIKILPAARRLRDGLLTAQETD